MTPDVAGEITRIRSTLRHSAGLRVPQDFLRFVYCGSFDKDWDELGLADEHRNIVEVLITATWNIHEVEDSTGGLRLLRFQVSEEDSRMVVIGFVVFQASSVAAPLFARLDGEDLDLTTAKREVIARIIKRLGELIATGA